jgi:hypothetical protein
MPNLLTKASAPLKCPSVCKGAVPYSAPHHSYLKHMLFSGLLGIPGMCSVKKTQQICTSLNGFALCIKERIKARIEAVDFRKGSVLRWS